MSFSPVISPSELAKRLGIDEPTAEQAAVIAAPQEPMVVMAGAGSGKSETMAARVVWLVANGLVRPERVLGLTFTRKAAGELAARVRRRLDQLREIGVVEADVLDGEPAISTYHAYAGRLVADHALREAMEPTMRLITEAVSWQVAARVTAAYDGPMDSVPWIPANVTNAVLALAGEMAEHLAGPEEIRQIGEWLRAGFDALPKQLKMHRDVLNAQSIREELLPLVDLYGREKRRRELIDHGDQVALAARLARNHPEVGMVERSRYSVVLLDEYQDTSHAQLVLLRALYGGGHPVTAVGDPCQSIYGWRGASAGNLPRFATDFPQASGSPSPVRQLATSFRNGERILAVAERLQRDLREDATSVPVLKPGAARADRGAVVCALHETAHDEAEWVAAEIERVLGLETAPDGLPGEGVTPRDVAILARKRSQFPALRTALEERGIPVEVVGLGGLLAVPEVADIVATLRVLHDPTAGPDLVRLLTGPRWQVGPRDLVALGDRARELSAADSAQEEGDALDEVVAELGAEEGSLVDALDDPGPAERYSARAFERFVRLRDELRGLRAQSAQPLPDLVTEVERTLGLDVEVTSRPGVDTVTARADLDAFADAASRFAGDEEDPTLGAFIAYLKAAEEEEHGLDAGRVGESDSVKLMTVHAAKGLQWPVIVVPGLAQMLAKSGNVTKGSMFPASPAQKTQWTENARKLPYPLRGDARDLPGLGGLAELKEFHQACADRDLLEERRLAYVAVTRAHYLLIASGYRWGNATKPLRPSVFLEEIREVCGAAALWADEPEEDAENPLLAEPVTAEWPAKPEDAEPIGDAARLVLDAIEGHDRFPSDIVHGALPEHERERLSAWARDAELLLLERDRNRGVDRSLVDLPAHLSVSSLVTLASDPGALARQIRRPLPRAPAPYARRGTTFHRWLESRWGQQRLIDDWEITGAADDEIAEDAALEMLKARFEESEWAGREPVEIEVPFETMIGDRQIRGRMDAVFRSGDGGFEVVDWKTGAVPSGKDAGAAAVQLAAYRLAWADLAGVPVSEVRAAFHYVKAGETVRPVDLLDRDGLWALLDGVPSVSSP